MRFLTNFRLFSQILPKTVGKRTFSYDSSLNSYCNPIDFDLVVTHQAGTNGTTVITVTSVLGLGQGTFYYTDLNNTVSGNHLASGSNSSWVVAVK